jgi:poly(hydroxyalkanoate) granule-associated protein
MVKKLKSISEKKSSSSCRRPAGQPPGQTVKDSAQQIWLAGMGAFSKAQEEGGKVFEALVKEGMTLQKKTQGMAEEKISEVTGKMSAMAGTVTSKAGQNWDKLEAIFEQRTAKALNKLGVPTAKDVEALTQARRGTGCRGGPPRQVGPGRCAKAATKVAAKPAAKAPAKAAPAKAPAARQPRHRSSAPRASRLRPERRRRCMTQGATAPFFPPVPGDAHRPPPHPPPAGAAHRAGVGRRRPAGRDLRGRRAVRAGRHRCPAST